MIKMTLNEIKKITNFLKFSKMIFLTLILISLLLISLSKAQNLNETIKEDLYKVENIENLKLNIQIKEIKEKIYKEFHPIASAYADFHEAILDFFNKVILLNLNSEEVKSSYLNVVQANNKLLILNKGFEHDFFKGKISKKIVENFFDGLITIYDSWVKSHDVTITSEAKEIYQSMIDNYSLIIKENKEHQISNFGKGFHKYKILFKKQIKDSVIGKYPYVSVHGIEVLKEKGDL